MGGIKRIDDSQSPSWYGLCFAPLPKQAPCPLGLKQLSCQVGGVDRVQVGNGGAKKETRELFGNDDADVLPYTPPLLVFIFAQVCYTCRKEYSHETNRPEGMAADA